MRVHHRKIIGEAIACMAERSARRLLDEGNRCMAADPTADCRVYIATSDALRRFARRRLRGGR